MTRQPWYLVVLMMIFTLALFVGYIFAARFASVDVGFMPTLITQAFAATLTLAIPTTVVTLANRKDQLPPPEA
jgi:hypothetical protein